MVLSKGQLPGRPRGHRILVRPDPPVEDSQIILTPEDQKFLPNKGRIIAAGLTALDQMHDHGDRVGDEIWWGKFAGVMEACDHIDHEGKGWESCDHLWVRQPNPMPRTQSWRCDNCKSTRLAEHMLIMMVDDILANVSLARRIESGEVTVVRGKTHGGQTQHTLQSTGEQ